MFRLAVVVSEFLTTVAHVVINLKFRKDFETVQNVGELIFTRFGIAATDFAGESAVDDCGRGVAVAGFPFGNANGKNGAIERVDWLGDGEGFVVDEKFDRRDNVAKAFVIEQFAEFDSSMLLDPILQVGTGQIEELFGESVVGNDDSSCRSDLDVGF